MCVCVCDNENNIVVFKNRLDCTHDKFGDTKGVIKFRKSKDRQYTGQKKKGRIMIYSTLHSKLKLMSTNPTQKRGRTHVLWKGNQFLLQ
jgi:hypothetical protein